MDRYVRLSTTTRRSSDAVSGHHFWLESQTDWGARLCTRKVLNSGSASFAALKFHLMLTIDEALRRVVDAVQPLTPANWPLSACLGLTLAAEIISDVDSPPFDKALMDGYAVRSADLATGQATLAVIEQVTAGQVPRKTVQPGTASQVMTGAPLPPGADAVVRIEDTRADGGQVIMKESRVSPGMNVMRRGAALRIGERVMTAGMPLSPARIAALAELGHAAPLVYPRPRASVLATGDELVAMHETPGPGQIRNSNEPMLTAQLAEWGLVVRSLGIARDSHADLSAKIEQGLQGDLFVLSGGVSAGKLDLVPAALAAAGVETAFHKVDMRPGKPVWFGIRRWTDRSPCYVFGLPGNPVSSMVCCELFVRAAVRRLVGLDPAIPQPQFARLQHNYASRGDRPTFHPAELTTTAQGLTARLVAWQGSSDLRATVEANGTIFMPAGERSFHEGDAVEAHVWGRW